MPGEAVDLRQAKPGALAHLLGCEEGFEDPRGHRLVHSDARVVDADADIAAGRGAFDLALPQADGRGFHADHAALGDRVAGVDRQVHQGGVELAGVQTRHRAFRAQGEDEADGFADRALEEGFGFPHQVVDVGGLRLQGLATGEGEQLLGQALAPAGGGERRLDHPFAPLNVVGPALDEVQGADHHGEQVVEVMGHAAGQLSHRLEPLRPAQGHLGAIAIGERRLHPLGHQVVDVLEIGLDLLGLGDVIAGADEAAELTLGADARPGDGPHPPPFPIGPAVARLQDEGLAGGLARHLVLQDAVVVLGMQALAPVEGEGGLVAGAEEVDIGLVHELAAAVGVGDPHQDGHAVGQRAEAQFALAQFGLRAPPLGDVDVDADGPAGAALLLQDLAARQQPSHRAVRPHHAVLHRLEGPVASLPAHIPHALLVVGMDHAHHRLDARRLGRIEAEIAMDGAGPVGLAGLQVPVPDADAAGLLGQLQPRLGLVEGPADLRFVPPGLLQADQSRPEFAGEPDGDHARYQVHHLQGQHRAGAGEGARPQHPQHHGRSQGRPAPAASGIEGGGDESGHIGDRHAEPRVQPDEGDADQHAQGQAGRTEGQGPCEARRLAADEGQQSVLRSRHRGSPCVPSAFSPASGCI